MSIDRLTKLSSRKLELLKELLALSLEQERDLDDEKEFERITLQKEKIIKTIDELDFEFVDSFNKIKNDFDVKFLGDITLLNTSEVQSLKENVRQIKEIMGSLVDKNNSMESRLILKKIDLSKQGINITRGDKVRNAYQGPISAGLNYLDRRK